MSDPTQALEAEGEANGGAYAKTLAVLAKAHALTYEQARLLP